MPGESALRSIPAEKRAEHEETGLPGPGRTAGVGAKVGCLGHSAVELEIKVKSRRESEGVGRTVSVHRLTEGE